MKIQKSISAFVASPSDTMEERAILDKVVAEFNKTWADFIGIRIDIIKWETHTRPMINSDAQAAINEQIDDDYDIFIGIIKKRLGTPTPRADSGTIEEFERAYTRYKETRIPEIMFYIHSDFHSTPEVKSFVDRLKTLGVYYWSYENNIAYLWRIHLSKLIQHLAKNQSVLQPKKQQFPVPDTLQLQRGVELSRQFLNIGSAKYEEYTIHAENLLLIVRAIGKLANETNAKLEKLILNRPGFRRQSNAPNKIKKLMLDFSVALSEYAIQINEILPKFVITYSEIMDALGNALSVTAPFAPLPIIFKESFGRVKQTISRFDGELVTLRNNIVQARRAISGWPDMKIAEFKNSKFQFLGALDNADHVFSQNIRLAREYELILEDYLDSIS